MGFFYSMSYFSSEKDPGAVFINISENLNIKLLLSYEKMRVQYISMVQVY